MLTISLSEREKTYLEMLEDDDKRKEYLDEIKLSFEAFSEALIEWSEVFVEDIKCSGMYDLILEWNEVTGYDAETGTH
jgi:hypothetical protein